LESKENMSVWETYPVTYRQEEVQQILSAVQAGACVSVVGLSGAGKSNLVGFMAHRENAFPHPNALVDCNRLREISADAFFRLVRQSLGDASTLMGNAPDGKGVDELAALEDLLRRRLSEHGGSLCILLDRFDILADIPDQVVVSNLRALRDAYKYQLTYVITTRRPLNPDNELSELFFAHTLWLGPLNRSDVNWNVKRYARQVGQTWGENVTRVLLELTRGYPSLLRAACEAYANGTKLELNPLRQHPAVRRRVDEFWKDCPSERNIQNTGLDGLQLLEEVTRPGDFDTSRLTAKEALLFEYLRSHPEEVCTKDDLIRAVWPEDQIFEQGIRDDSLAQLVRRTRIKIEPDPSAPIYIHTVPGRGYRFTPQE
jgi:energy-coupling factor transporter ATP-binding protein EcfA2